MKTVKLTKADLIKEIAMAVNANADRTAGSVDASRRFDGDMFLSLAFRTEKELTSICKKAGIRI